MGEGKLIIFRRRSSGKHSLKNVNYEMATRICVYIYVYRCIMHVQFSGDYLNDN